MNQAIPPGTLIPLKVASNPTGIPRRTLYRWAATGQLAVVIIDGERCATLSDILNLDMTRREHTARNRMAL